MRSTKMASEALLFGNVFDTPGEVARLIGNPAITIDQRRTGARSRFKAKPPNCLSDHPARFPESRRYDKSIRRACARRGRDCRRRSRGDVGVAVRYSMTATSFNIPASLRATFTIEHALERMRSTHVATALLSEFAIANLLWRCPWLPPLCKQQSRNCNVLDISL